MNAETALRIIELRKSNDGYREDDDNSSSSSEEVKPTTSSEQSYHCLDAPLQDQLDYINIDEKLEIKPKQLTINETELDATWEDNFESRRNNGLITTSDLLWFALQIARAMQFLTERKVLHRDVALRNVLLKPDFTLKIADFGLSRKLDDGDEAYHIWKNTIALPLRYMAPESFTTGLCTVHSECFSFGIVIWELFTFAVEQPYALEYSDSGGNEIFVDFLRGYLLSGHRLSLPENIPIRLLNHVKNLWNEDPVQRPSFQTSRKLIRNELLKSCQKILRKEQTLHLSNLHPSEASLLKLGDPEQSKQQEHVLQQQQQPQKQLQQLQSESVEEIQLQPSQLKHGKQVVDEDLRFKNGRRYWTKILAMVAAVAFVILLVALLIWFIAFETKGKESTATYATRLFLNSSKTYDCVNASRSKVILDEEVRELAELNIPEMQPTWTVGHLEYLLVPNATQRKGAQKICTAWCGHLVPISGPEQNDRILDLVRNNLPTFSSYWIGLRGWKGNWYMDDESNVTFFNFPDQEEANRCIVNTADNAIEIEKLRFEPFQEKECASIRGMCDYETDCIKRNSTVILNVCPLQAINIRCCVPKIPKPTPMFNFSATTCAEAGGICNHVQEDECRDGVVVFNLTVPCPDRPRGLDCCMKNHTAFRKRL